MVDEITVLIVLLTAFFAAVVITVSVDFWYVWHHVGSIVRFLTEMEPDIKHFLEHWDDDRKR